MPLSVRVQSGVRSQFTSPDYNEIVTMIDMFNTPGDVAVRTDSDILMSRNAVSNGNRGGLCSHHSVGCLMPRCGPVGQVVKLRWKGVDCGPGITMTLNCSFGGVVTTGTFVADAAVRDRE